MKNEKYEKMIQDSIEIVTQSMHDYSINKDKGLNKIPYNIHCSLGKIQNKFKIMSEEYRMLLFLNSEIVGSSQEQIGRNFYEHFLGSLHGFENRQADQAFYYKYKSMENGFKSENEIDNLIKKYENIINSKQESKNKLEMY